MAAGLELIRGVLLRGSTTSTFTYTGGTLSTGTAGVTGFLPTPEPGKLGLLGSGVLDLAGLIRQKITT